MLRAIPKGWLSSNFKILENDVEIAELNFKFASEEVNIEIQGIDYKFEPRETYFSGGSYVIESNNSVLAVAERPGMLGEAFSFVLGEKQYQLRPESGWSLKFILLEGEQEVGAIYPEGVFSSRAIAELPADISLPVKVFILWLVVLLWKRDADTAAIVAATI
jgi:hypothetical protein